MKVYYSLVVVERFPSVEQACCRAMPGIIAHNGMLYTFDAVGNDGQLGCFIAEFPEQIVDVFGAYIEEIAANMDDKQADKVVTVWKEMHGKSPSTPDGAGESWWEVGYMGIWNRFVCPAIL